MLLLALGTGCTQLKGNFSRQLSAATFKFQVIERSPGAYTIAGNTDLPDNSKVAVAAVRYLYPANQSAQNLKLNPTYSILDYQAVEVKQGKWQTTLNLWKAAPDGRFQETWQFDQAQLRVPFKPVKEVVFLATVAPVRLVDQLRSLEQQLAKQKMKLDAQLIRTTAEGQQYVQVSQTQTVPLPAGSSKPPVSRPEELNGGWGNRFLMPKESQNPYKLELPAERKTNAPMASQEFLR